MAERVGFEAVLKRLHADLGVQRGVTEANQVGSAKTDRIDVRGSGALALPPFPHRGCPYCARNPCRGHYEQKPFPIALSDFLCSRATQVHHISWLQGRPPSVVRRSHSSQGKGLGVSSEKRRDHLAFSARVAGTPHFPRPRAPVQLPSCRNPHSLLVKRSRRSRSSPG